MYCTVKWSKTRKKEFVVVGKNNSDKKLLSMYVHQWPPKTQQWLDVETFSVGAAERQPPS